MLLRWLIAPALIGILVACSPAPQPPTPTLTPVPTATTIPQPDTPWGDISTLAEAPVFSPPALISDKTGFIAATFVPFRDGWRLTLYHNDQPIQTDITARNPYALNLYPASKGGVFAVWLDYDGGSQSQLYASYVTADGDSELGAILLTDAPAVRVSAAPMPDGGLWLVWSTALIPESVLMVSRLDGLGRPRIPQRLIGNADYPALLRADGRTWLYWLAATDGSLYRAELTEAQTLDDTVRLTGGLSLEIGDIFTGLSVGADTTTAYVFWQVVQNDRRGQVWWTAGKLTDMAWDSPRRLSVAFDPDNSDIQAGFNHGEITAAQLGEASPVDWLHPAAGQSDTLPTAGSWRTGVGIFYWRDGELFAGQRLEDGQRLIAAPAVAYDSERDLALMWWGVLNDQAAALSAVYSRR